MLQRSFCSEVRTQFPDYVPPSCGWQQNGPPRCPRHNPQTYDYVTLYSKKTFAAAIKALFKIESIGVAFVNKST